MDEAKNQINDLEHEEAKNQINDLELKEAKTNQSEQQKTERIQKNEDSISKL